MDYQCICFFAKNVFGESSEKGFSATLQHRNSSCSDLWLKSTP